MNYDLCFAWNWKYDIDFVAFLETACSQQSISLFQVTPANLKQAIEAALSGELHCRVFYDRASDDDPHFFPLVEWAHQHHIRRINGYFRSCRASDKATNHYKLINAGLNTPYGIIIPPYAEKPELSPIDLTPLGTDFIMKPAHGGGSIGVIAGVTSWEQVLAFRQKCPDDQYLLQARIEPVLLEDRPAWFRVIACTGEIYPFWWNPVTHEYMAISEDEASRLGLHPLWEMTVTLGHVAELELFSTEIAITPTGNFVVVDYINDPIDLRLQSKAVDGIPDATVADIAQRLATFVCQDDSITHQ